MEELGKLIAHFVIEQNGFGPTFACSQYVTVREAATRHDTFKAVQRNSTREQITHMHIDSAETSTVESRGHLNLTVNPLFTQDSNRGTHTTINEGRGNIFLRIVGQLNAQSGIILQQALKLLFVAVRVIAQRLHTVAGFRPEALQNHARLIENHFTVLLDMQPVFIIRLTDYLHAVSAGINKTGHYRRGMIATHL